MNKVKILIYNLSIPGGTTKAILERFEAESKIREADFVIFQTGGNDSSYYKNKNERLVEIGEFEENIKKIITKSKVFAEKSIFIGFNNCDESKTTPVSWCDICFTNENIKKYNEAMKNICIEQEVDFLDIFGLLNDADFSDGLHPNAEGHRKIFEKVKEFLFKREIIS